MEPLNVNPAGIQQVLQSYNDARNVGAPKAQTNDDSSSAPQTDEITISPEAQELQRLVQSAHLAEDVRGEQIQEIRTRLRTGAYMLDPQAIAARMLGLGGQ
jgi:flagellar biosynthesis anti-sigma factor FlgM